MARRRIKLRITRGVRLVRRIPPVRGARRLIGAALLLVAGLPILVLLGTAGGLTGQAAWEALDGPEPRLPWIDFARYPDAASSAAQAHLTVSADRTNVRAEYRVRLPLDHPLIGLVATGQAVAAPVDLSTAAFGTVVVGDLPSTRPQIEMRDEGDSTALVTVGLSWPRSAEVTSVIIEPGAEVSRLGTKLTSVDVGVSSGWIELGPGLRANSRAAAGTTILDLAPTWSELHFDIHAQPVAVETGVAPEPPVPSEPDLAGRGPAIRWDDYEGAAQAFFPTGLKLQADAARVDATFRTVVPYDHPMVGMFLDGEAKRAVDHYVRSLLGSVKPGREPWLGPWQLRLEKLGDRSVAVVAERSWRRAAGLSTIEIDPGAWASKFGTVLAEVEVHVSSGRLEVPLDRSSLAPTEEATTVPPLRTPGPIVAVDMTTFRMGTAASILRFDLIPNPPTRSGRQSVGQTILALTTDRLPAPISRAVIEFLIALPLLLLWLVASGKLWSRRHEVLARGALTLLCMHLFVAVIDVVTAILFLRPLFLSLLHHLPGWDFPSDQAKWIDQSDLVVLIAGAVLAPWLVAGLERTAVTSTRSRRWVPFWAFGVLAVLASAAVGLDRVNKIGSVVPAVVLSVGLALVVGAGARLLCPDRPTVGLAAVTGLTALALTIVAGSGYGAGRPGPWTLLRSVALLAVGLVLAVTFARGVLLAVTQTTLASRWLALRWRWRVGAVVVAAVLFIPTPRPFGGETGFVGLHVFFLFFRLDDLLLFALAALVIRVLRENDGEVKRRGHRAASGLDGRQMVSLGVVLLLAIVYTSTARFHYFPVAFLLGLFALVLIVQRPAAAGPGIDYPAASRRADALRDIVEIRRAERVIPKLERKLLDSVAKGDMTHSQYLEKVSEQRASVAGLRENTLGSFDAREGLEPLALGYGPGSTAWEGGKIMAQWAVLLAIPWILLSLRGFFGSTQNDPAFSVMVASTAVVRSLTVWAVLGFVFGYCYPYIRGRTGLTKAAHLLVAILVPWVLLTALLVGVGNRTWGPFIVWSLQIALQLVLLGLVVGDVRAARQAGLSWRSVIDLHNLNPLAAYGSALVVAVGGVVTAVVTATVTTVLTAQLQFLGPQDSPKATEGTSGQTSSQNAKAPPSSTPQP